MLSRFVLTAAHCVIVKDNCQTLKDNTDKLLKVFSGLYAYDQSNRDIIRRSTAKEWILHQRYCPDRDPSMLTVVHR